jgi:murein tripeptide amidase MpaA
MSHQWCQIPGCERPVENRDTGLCATHSKASRMKEPEQKQYSPIKKVSTKRKGEMANYKILSEEFIKNKRCAVYPNQKATEVHHKMGRVGYADDWARENNITLLMDERFWLPVSRQGHVQIELRPLWAKKEGFSDSRLIDAPAPMDRYLPEPPTI